MTGVQTCALPIWAICLAAGYAATEKSQAYWRCGKSGSGTGKADRKMEDRNTSVPDLSVISFQAVHQARISPAKGRIQQARAKPPKATTRPPQGHILGIDSGVQSHHKATPRPPQSHILWSTEAPQGHPKATPRLHQGSTKAPPRPHQGSTKATPMRPQSHPQATPKLSGGLPAPWSLSCTSQTGAGCPGESWETRRTYTGATALPLAVACYPARIPPWLALLTCF